MLSEICDTIPPTPKIKFKHFSKTPSHISLIELEEELEVFEVELLIEKNNEKNKESNGIFIPNGRYEDSFREKEFDIETENGRLREK